MAQPVDLQELKERFEGHSGPLLSVYLNVNPADQDNQGQAYLVRLKDALGEVGAPEGISDRVRETLEDEQPRARTFVLFADEDGLFEWYRLQSDLPESVRYGEPYLSPLALALDEHEPYGIVMVDAEEYRFYITSPAEDPSEASWQMGSGFLREIDLHPSRPHPRGGRDVDPVSRRSEAHIHEWYNELGKLTRDVAFSEGARHLILAGPKERTAEFRNRLPEDVRSRVVAETQIQENSPDNETLQRLQEVREQAEEERKSKLLDEVRESGVSGVKDTLEALQEGRVYHVLALWNLDAEVRWSETDGLVMPDVAREESPYTGDETEVRPLMEVLVDLAANRGSRLEFVRDEGGAGNTPEEDLEEARQEASLADTIRQEFEGLAGLLRY